MALQSLAIDVETSKIPRHLPWCSDSFLSCVGVYAPSIGPRTWVFNHEDATNNQTEADALQEINNIVSDARRIVAHNLKFDLHWLNYAKIDTSQCRPYCTQVAEYVINGQDKSISYSLADTSKRYGIADKIDIVKQYWDAGYETSEVPLNVLLPYLEQDCINAYNIMLKQVPVILANNQQNIVSVQMEAIRVLVDMEQAGALINVDVLDELAAEYTQLKEETEEELYKLFGARFNLGSNAQLSAYLFGGVIKEPGVEIAERVLKNGTVKKYERKCVHSRIVTGVGFKPPRGSSTKVDGVYKVNKDVLPMLVARNKKQQAIVETILRRSEIEKNLTSYFVGPREHVQDDGCIHFNMNQTVTATGRLSCSNPNFQNYPRKGTSPAKRPVISRWPTPSKSVI